MMPKILQNINSPDDLKVLEIDELDILAAEIRSLILDVVSVHPGHLGASLGAVELTIALHYSFNAPADTLVWDVGHQAYAHKIITGRKKQFHTLRQLNGISGFPLPKESEYDSFVAGHASTAISAALGMEKASLLNGDNDRHFIAIMGDGGLTGGMAFEALNNAADSNILVVLNDNQIAIDKNTGSIGNYLQKLVKTKADKARAFESLGFNYYGPVDGHNIKDLINSFNKLKNIKGPKLIHVLTVKGKGFKKAEEDQTMFHAPGKFDRKTGNIYKEKQDQTFPELYGSSLIELAEKNSKLVVVTPAMTTGSSLQKFQEKFPKRIFDVGIAEQHAVTFSAGLAKEGLKPFCTIYSTFLQRAYDQIIHDVALQNLPVVFAIDRAGIVGEDGATHHGAFDMAFMRSIPNMVVSAPMDGKELVQLMKIAENYNNGPFSIRYSKGSLPYKYNEPSLPVKIGKGQKVSEGEKVALVTIGYAGVLAQKAVIKLNENNIFPAHFNMRFLKPIDTELLTTIFEHFETVITVEDGIIKGGLADAVLEIKEQKGFSTKLVSLGIPDKFITHGKREELYDMCGFSPEKIAEIVKTYFN